MENITSFFFNIIPSILLILILETKSNFKIMSQVFGIEPLRELNFLWLIVFSILIGFFLQALTKLAKETFLYQIIFCKVKEEDPDNFAEAEKYLDSKKLLPENETGKLRVRRIFYTMDNYISLSGGGRLLPHFASRLAYWFNLFWVSLAILILSKNIIDNVIIASAGIVFVISTYETWVHLKNHYDILLKTFISYIKIDKENDSNLIMRSHKK